MIQTLPEQLADDPWMGTVAPLPSDAEADTPAPGRRQLRGMVTDEFYADRPELEQIRQAGHSRNRSGYVALLATMTRLSALVPHYVKADTGVADYVSLNLFVAVVGASGTGKTSGVSVSRRLLNPLAEMDFRSGLPIGSGEGIAEVFMGTVEEPTGELKRNGDPVMRTVRAQVRHNAEFNVDEGATLTRLMRERSGSTLGETLRSAVMGQTLGQTNASKETSRYIPAGSYSMSLLVGFQPETAVPLFDEIAEGTPQRFLWAPVTDPSIPDEPCDFPGELTAWKQALNVRQDFPGAPVLITFDEQITTELRRVDLAKARGEIPAEEMNPLDSHAPVMLIKLSSLLAILAGRLNVTQDDWRRAEMLWAASCETRDWVIEYRDRQRLIDNEKRTQARIAEELRLAQAQVEAAEEREDKAVERVARRIASIVHEKGALSRTAIRSKLAGRDKKHITDAIAYAVLRDWVLEADGKAEPGGSRPR